ncbi:MAG: hypothetical protein ACK5KU_03090 [Beutenbergiaceae bacterium]
MTVLALVAMTAVAHPAQAQSQGPVVLIGVPGLSWSDVRADPVLAELLGVGDAVAAGSLVVRSTNPRACPADGWLAISTGTRTDSGAARRGFCQPPTHANNGQVPAWPAYSDQATQGPFTVELGLLAETLDQAGRTSSAIGPGAALALANSDGRIADYQPRSLDLGRQVSDAVATSDLVVVDLGNTLLFPRDRATIVAGLAQQIQQVLTATAASEAKPVVMLSGISDDRGSARLRVFALLDPSADTGAELTSSSTRQPGYVLATDQHATILAYLGIAPQASSAVGAPMTASESGDDLIMSAIDRERHADAQRPVIGGFFLVIVVLNVSIYAAVAVGLRRPQWAKALATRRKPTLRTLRLVTLSLAAVPVASLLTNLLPWWRAPWPVISLVLGIVAWVAVIVALALNGPWRRAPLGSAAMIAGLTATVIAVDIMTGAQLQVSAVMGISPTVAGRFYGMNNSAFSLFTASSLVAATAIANALVARGHRRLAAAVVVAIGLAAIVIDGAPFWGADFGGPPALLAAFGILSLLAAGVRLTFKRVLLVLTGAGAITFGIAFLDWLRPVSSRTHLGRFIDDVFNGELWPIVARKLDQNLSILLGNRPLTILAICGVLLVVFVLIRPVRKTVTSAGGGDFGWLSQGAPLSAMAGTVPMLAPGLIALATAAGLGFALNDSGIAIPAMVVAIAVPLLLASAATWMLGRPNQSEDASSDVVGSATDSATSAVLAASEATPERAG